MDNRFLEPFLNLEDEYFPHLAVGDDQFIYAALDFSRLRQITRGIRSLCFRKPSLETSDRKMRRSIP